MHGDLLKKVLFGTFESIVSQVVPKLGGYTNLGAPTQDTRRKLHSKQVSSLLNEKSSSES
jgi:hypothetical protein